MTHVMRYAQYVPWYVLRQRAMRDTATFDDLIYI